MIKNCQEDTPLDIAKRNYNAVEVFDLALPFLAAFFSCIFPENLQKRSWQKSGHIMYTFSYFMYSMPSSFTREKHLQKSMKI